MLAKPNTRAPSSGTRCVRRRVQAPDATVRCFCLFSDAAWGTCFAPEGGALARPCVTISMTTAPGPCRELCRKPILMPTVWTPALFVVCLLRVTTMAFTPVVAQPPVPVPTLSVTCPKLLVLPGRNALLAQRPRRLRATLRQELLMLPKAVLGAPVRGGTRHKTQLGQHTRRRCLRWLDGERSELWEETVCEPRRRATARPTTDTY